MGPFDTKENEMNARYPAAAILLLSAVFTSAPAPAQGQASSATAMSFFLTSAGPGRGANLGGLNGADQHCQKLATAVGAGSKTWHAYLSENGSAGHPTRHARERIGTGPWYNAKGVLIARTVDELHGDKVNVTKETALTEKGEAINGRGDNPNRHDVLTGSQPDGTAFPGTDSANTTCGNWVRYFPNSGKARVGHHDRQGNDPKTGSSWNSAHDTQGCSQEELRATGGEGLFYCFAIN
jgi:hypothetical protein